MKIRAATVEDAAEIGKVHVASLRSSHQGLLPESFLGSLSSEHRANVWKDALTKRVQTHFIFVAELEGKVIGFSACGPEPSMLAEKRGEIYTCYVLAEQQGVGVGRALINADLREFANKNYKAVVLWVLSENKRAREFYEHMGGKMVGEKVEEFAGVPTQQVAYGWELSKQTVE
jgi:ribosomal protein S18 acetylase RimI-like enzyme